MSTPSASPRPHPVRRLLKRGATAVLWLGLAAAVAMVAASLLGLQRYVITGQSMTGSIDRGSLVWDRVVPTTSLKVGDVITYDPSSPLAPEGNVTHRIVWTGPDATGQLGFRTKGDFNDHVDPWRFTLGPTSAKTVFHVPYAGYVLAYASQPRFRMLVIGLPALLVALAVLAGLWKEAGAEVEAIARQNRAQAA